MWAGLWKVTSECLVGDSGGGTGAQTGLIPRVTDEISAACIPDTGSPTTPRSAPSADLPSACIRLSLPAAGSKMEEDGGQAPSGSPADPQHDPG